MLNGKLEKSDIPVLADFLALMHTRVPRTLEFCKEIGGVVGTYLLQEASKNPDEIKVVLEECREKAGMENLPSLEEVQAFFLNIDEKFRVEVKRPPALLLSVIVTKTVIEQLLQMDWYLLHAPGDVYFITGDAPLTAFVLEKDGTATFGAGLSESDVEVTFPLSSSRCLYLCRRNTEQFSPVMEVFVRDINRRTAYMAERFIISPLRTREIQQLVRESSVTIKKSKIDKEIMLKRIKAEGRIKAYENGGQFFHCDKSDLFAPY